MNQVSIKSCLLQGLLAAGLLAGPVAALADPLAECRQEVQDYSIPPEQEQDYIDGCILSRGGALVTDPDAGVPAEEGAGLAPQQGDEYTEAQPLEAGQADGVLPGGSNGAY